MKTAIIGSRGINNKKYIFSILDTYKISMIISGGANGVDLIAEEYATINNIEKIIYKPNYNKYGKSAPIRRNDTIIYNSELIIAFWDGCSKGTKYVINKAIKTKKTIIIYVQ